ncbi:hypothetical protein PRZ48_003463 [Zasmidium cellare]|uniref:SGNH hydrolase-type esterase domain-containing protein n=1 Tax=Zasmidium cellare TaxID=395010 RepID=A0ABR0EWN8_ZASCE|nr:hypothetical protein PRZ48_003463 [Zasmidium cellare]
MALLLLLSYLVAHVSSIPFPIHNFLKARAPDFEWTAWGDSYASGVGAGNYVDGRRCLRYAGAYPVEISVDSNNLIASQGGGKFNNVVCSGAKVEDVEAYQFFTEDAGAEPDWQYYPRPATGRPTMGTLTIGGDDVDFPGLLYSCIMESFPFPMSVGFEDRTCEEQRVFSWSLLSQHGDHDVPNELLVGKLDGLIKAITSFGRDASGDGFRLYVTGYGQFFNDVDPGCDNITLARTANPDDDGEPHIKLTTDLRQDFNAMSRLLNLAIQQAVDLNNETNVRYIDIDSFLSGHRFCEPGIQEPDQNNPNLWFYHYPYNQSDDEDSDPAVKHLNAIINKHADKIVFDPNTTLFTDHLNAVWSTIDEKAVNKAAALHVQRYGPGNLTSEKWDFWGDWIGWRAKVFHPTGAFHERIYEAVVERWLDDTGA